MIKTTNFLTLLCIAFFGLFVASCNNNAEDNEITITIDEPIDGETIADCSDVHIHIDFVATDENHEIEVVLHPEGDVDDKIIDYDEHDHDKEITFEQEVDLCSYGAGTCFHLEVRACEDHDCDEVATAEVEFCI